MPRPGLPSLLLLALVLFSGCGDDATTTPPPPDASTSCGSGRHVCGSGCGPDNPNNPEVGCRLGCGTPCRAPAGGDVRCLSDGTCGFTCAAPYVRSGETCRCTARTCRSAMAQCGMLDDGCGRMLDCGRCGMGTECVDNHCMCVSDGAEPNDMDIRAFRLGTFPDEPDTMMSFDLYTLDTVDDVDFYSARVIDAAMSNPTIRVTLTGVPTADDWEVGAWFTCDAGGDASRCEGVGVTADMSFPPGLGCVSATGATGMARVQIQTFCATTSETGQLLIRVRSTTWTRACMPYHLSVSVT